MNFGKLGRVRSCSAAGDQLAEEKDEPIALIETDDKLGPVGTGKPDGWTKEEIAFYFDKALKVLNADNFTTAPEYIDLLVNQCLAEKHWSDAFRAFLNRLKEMGLEIAMEESDQNRLLQLNERLFYWRTCRMMINAAGLLRYEEEIMKYEIAKFYQPINPTPTLPPPRVQVPPNAGPRRKAEKPKHKSVLRPEPAAARPKQQPVPKPAPKPAAKEPVRINKPTK